MENNNNNNNNHGTRYDFDLIRIAASSKKRFQILKYLLKFVKEHYPDMYEQAIRVASERCNTRMRQRLYEEGMLDISAIESKLCLLKILVGSHMGRMVRL
jgi:hypothetical protein